jgi:alginate O-acetyltransferase complex protein AlgI
MTLAFILVSVVVAALLGLLTRNRWRVPLLLETSALAVFAFQPALPVRNLDFWLPTATLALATLAWILTTPANQRSWRTNWWAAAILAGTVLVLGLTRYLGYPQYLTASRPPQFLEILAGILLLVLIAYVLTSITKSRKAGLTCAFSFVIVLFIVLKFPLLATLVSSTLRDLNRQSTSLALAQDLRWIGFSYIAFRLLHTIRDSQSGRLPFVSLSEYVVYVIFFPALTAGPIDRIERFVSDLRRPIDVTPEVLGEAGKRLAIGMFKKFAVADVLAMVSLNATNALQVRTTGWAWVILYAFAFQIYFDFSGYTDIAIGLGRLLGFKLPENFNAPYLKPNLTQFWNNWHMTLTQWFRAYFFNPLTRALRSGKRSLPIPVIILITQVGTMVLIGLWHGVMWNFVIWGVWHGLGLFIHNRWSELTRARFAMLSSPWKTALNVGGVFLTFNFVALGWIFFTIPTLSVSAHFVHDLLSFG